jgi:hypothetical protein
VSLTPAPWATSRTADRTNRDIPCVEQNGEMNLLEGSFVCAACGEINDLLVDPSGGWEQSYVEDCHICCRPNVLIIRCDPGLESFTVEALQEGN